MNEKEKKELAKLDNYVCVLSSDIRLFFHNKISKEDFIKLFFEQMAVVLRQMAEFFPD